MPTQNIFDLVDTWASGGGPYTSIKMNATDNDSGSASLLMDLQVGASSKFSVAKNGTSTFGSSSVGLQANLTDIEFVAKASSVGAMHAGIYGIYMNSTLALSWASSSTNAKATVDTYLTRRAAANLRFGPPDAAAPVAQTLSVQSVVAGTTNTAGTNLTITGSQGTGTGAGGSIIFQVAPAGGTGIAQNGLVDALTISSTRNITIGGAWNDFQFRVPSGGGSRVFTIVDGATSCFTTSVSGTFSVGSFGLGASIPSPDVILARDAANTLALRNGTAAQGFNIYNTYTDASNYELGRLLWSGNNFYIQAISAGTGSSRNIVLQAGSGSSVITQSNFLFGNDNANDIGASGANRPRNVYVAGTVTSGGVEAPTYYATSATRMRLGETNGNVRFHNAVDNNFGLMIFGTATSSFPALKRSSTTLQARLADDSAFASVQGKLTTDTNYTAGTFTATGYLTLYDAAGTAYRVPCAV